MCAVLLPLCCRSASEYIVAILNCRHIIRSSATKTSGAGGQLMSPLCIMLRRQIPVYHGFIRLLPLGNNRPFLSNEVLNDELLKPIAILSISHCRDEEDASTFVLVRA